MGSFDELRGLKNGVAKVEAEMKELRRTLRLTQTTSPDSHAASKIIAEIQHCEEIRKGMLHDLSLQEPDFWRDFGDRFMELAREEQGRADVITKGETLRRTDKVLRISCNYQKHPEIWVNLEKPEERNFCLLHTPPHGLWGQYTGALSENLRERVRLCVAQAGRALPDYREGIDPEDFWLHRLYLDLLKNNSDSLFCASNEGGMIVSVCVASATFCTRLERRALEESESASPANSVKAPTYQEQIEKYSAWAWKDDMMLAVKFDKAGPFVKELCELEGKLRSNWKRGPDSPLELHRKREEIIQILLQEYPEAAEELGLRMPEPAKREGERSDTTSPAENNAKTAPNAESKMTMRTRNVGGRPRKDAERELIRKKKNAGKCWKEIADEVNQETGQQKTVDAYRSLLRSSSASTRLPGKNEQN